MARRRWVDLIEGGDGRLSTSKAQWFMWMAVVAGSYGAIFDARDHAGLGPLAPHTPTSVLIALGLSTITMTAAAALAPTAAPAARDRPDAQGASRSAESNLRGGLLTDDRGIADLSKVQLMVWTVLVLSIYVYSLSLRVGMLEGHQADTGIPDLDPTLLVLTGLSQAGYLGSKMVQRLRS
jgi:hypothetical protein